MIGDVEVVGLVPETVSLADIGMDVAHGIVVRIPADLASNSKDLWLAINQKRIFRLHAGPSPVNPRLVSHMPDDTTRLQDRIVTLERENAELRAEVAFERSKFDEILGLLKSGIPMAPRGTVPAALALAEAAASSPGVVEVETPTFIPSTIKGDATESRVTVQEGSSESGSVSGARSALRKMRQSSE